MDKETDGKLYRLYSKPGSHANTKVNDDGRKAAIQFRNEDNTLNGPLEAEEVDISEFSSKEMNPYIKWVLDNIAAPIIQRGLDAGANKLKEVLVERGIPSAKQAIKEFSKNQKLYIEGIRDGLLGKETKVSQLLRETEKEVNLQALVKNKEYEQEVEKCSPEEIKYVLETLKQSVIITATCIRILTNTIAFDDGCNPDKLTVAKKQLEELTTENIMSQINLMLEEKNRSLLDENSFRILSAFRNGNLIVGEKTVPISRYIDCAE